MIILKGMKKMKLKSIINNIDTINTFDETDIIEVKRRIRQLKSFYFSDKITILEVYISNAITRYSLNVDEFRDLSDFFNDMSFDYENEIFHIIEL